jgi:Pentapeptide repeats (8 copies)
MPIKKTRSIPVELQQIKAYELSQQWLSEGKESNSDDDWNDAGEYLAKHPRKILVWKLKKLRRSIKDVCWRVLVFPFWLLWKLPSLFAQADTRAFALDVVKTVITALGLIATFIAGIGLFVNYWSSEKNIQLTQERLVTERFSKAIDQLGSGKDEVILGGIYSLERIAKDSPKDRSTIMEVLSAFVRRNSPIRKNSPIIPTNGLINSKPSKELPKNNPVTITVQAALTVIGRRNPPDGKIHKDVINLTRANLREANLSEANLREANLLGVKLFGAEWKTKNFSRQIKQACNWNKTEYDDGVKIYGEKEAYYDDGKIDELKQEKASDPEYPIDCSRWKSRD